jgi:hypothetical protein
MLLKSHFVVRFTDSTLLVSSKLSSPLSLDVYTSQSLATGGHIVFIFKSKTEIVPYRSGLMT